MVIEVEHAADNGGTAAVVRLPVAIAEQRDLFVPGLHIACLRSAAQDGLYAKYIEGVGRDVVAAQALRLEISCEFDISHGRRRYAAEDVGLLRDFVKLL